MKHRRHEIELKSLGRDFPSPFITCFDFYDEHSLLVGNAFSKSLLLKVSLDSSLDKIEAQESMGLENIEDEGTLAVLGGLKYSLSGDTSFATLDDGSLPGFLKKMASKPWKDRVSADSLLNFLEEETGGMGFKTRHALYQIIDGDLRMRRAREGGALIDCQLLGGYFFGLTGKDIFREPYLNPMMKRHVLRSDLGLNGKLHKDDVYFWFLGAENRLFNMKVGDVKPKATRLKIKGAPFSLSAYSFVDGCLYGVGNDGRQLFRLRINPESGEEELQNILDLDDGKITGICSYEKENNPVLVYTVGEKSGGDAELFTLPMTAFEDPEIMEEVPESKSLGYFQDCKSVYSLTHLLGKKSNSRIWGFVCDQEGHRRELISFKI